MPRTEPQSTPTAGRARPARRPSGEAPEARAGRLEAVVDAATAVFGERGYRRTRMAHVARALGVATGTLYGYVAGKEALFALCVERAFGDPAVLRAVDLPAPTPDPEETRERVRRRLARSAEAATPRLSVALTRERVERPAAELAGLVAELYDAIAANRRGMQLLERSAAERPELAAVFFGEERERLLGRWERYLERRAAAGCLAAPAPAPDRAVAARLVLETCAWFAWHRHGDPAPPDFDEARARETVVALLTRALAGRGPEA